MRFEFPNAASRYEFRFEPLPGATVIDAFQNTETFEQLDAANGTQQRIIAHRLYGQFIIYYTGRRVAQATLLTNVELGGTTRGFEVEESGKAVTQLEVENYRVDNGVDTGHGQAHGWRNEVLGFPQQNQGQTKSRDIYKTLDDGRSVKHPRRQQAFTLQRLCPSRDINRNFIAPGLGTAPGLKDLL